MFGVLRNILCRKSISTTSRTFLEPKNVFRSYKRNGGSMKSTFNPFSNQINSVKRIFAEKTTTRKVMYGALATLGALTIINSYMSTKIDPIKKKIAWNIRKAYAMLFSSIIGILAGSFLLRKNVQYMRPIYAFGLIMFWMLLAPPVLYSIPYEKAPFLKYLGMVLCIYPLSLTLAFTSHFVASQIYSQSVLAASALFTGLLVVGSVSPMGQYDSLIGVLSVGSVILFAACVASLLSPAKAGGIANGVYYYIGLPVVAGLTVLLSQNVKKQAVAASESGKPFDPVNCVLPLMINFVNMVNMMVNYLSRRSGR